MRVFFLLWLLAIGPLQAQVAFDCAMMDTVVPNCCCDDTGMGTDALRADPTLLPESGQTPCCEISVEINVDQEARQHALSGKPPDQRFDVDPPDALVVSFDTVSPTAPGSAPHGHSFDRASIRAGSNTYLVTLRLRI